MGTYHTAYFDSTLSRITPPRKVTEKRSAAPPRAFQYDELVLSFELVLNRMKTECGRCPRLILGADRHCIL